MSEGSMSKSFMIISFMYWFLSVLFDSHSKDNIKEQQRTQNLIDITRFCVHFLYPNKLIGVALVNVFWTHANKELNN